MMRLLLTGATLLFGGCLSQPNAPEPALYDLGIAPERGAIHATATVAPIASRLAR